MPRKNKLSREARAQILGLMVEGMSMRTNSRTTGASKNTIVKLLEDAGEAFSVYQDRNFRDLSCKRVQVDEVWTSVYAKEKNLETAKNAPTDAGDVWTWMAIDADTKLIPLFTLANAMRRRHSTLSVVSRFVLQTAFSLRVMN